MSNAFDTDEPLPDDDKFDRGGRKWFWPADQCPGLYEGVDHDEERDRANERIKKVIKTVQDLGEITIDTLNEAFENDDYTTIKKGKGKHADRALPFTVVVMHPSPHAPELDLWFEIAVEQMLINPEDCLLD